MKKEHLVELLNVDIRNEWTHLHFYLHSAAMVAGLHRAEIKEFLLEEAASEMKHIEEFGCLIIGLDGTPASMPIDYPTDLMCPRAILKYALELENTVVENYSQRMDQAKELGGADGKWIEAFLENQIIDSRKGANNLKQLVKQYITPEEVKRAKCAQ